MRAVLIIYNHGKIPVSPLFDGSDMLFPMIFMFGNAIAQSSLPIVSYNYGLGKHGRIHEVFVLTVILAAGLGVAMSILGFLFAPQIVDIFITRPSNASSIGETGVPLFLLACLPFTLNVVLIGYLQSMEAYRQATLFMLLRGFILIIPCFILLPKLWGINGLWLAEPVSETLTLMILIGYLTLSHSGRHSAEGIAQ